MLLAVALQILGAILVVAGVSFMFGFSVALVVAGLIVFAAGYAHEQGLS